MDKMPEYKIIPAPDSWRLAVRRIIIHKKEEHENKWDLWELLWSPPAERRIPKAQKSLCPFDAVGEI